MIRPTVAPKWFPSDPLRPHPDGARRRREAGGSAREVWLVGRHRLICGDAAEPGVLARLLVDEKIDLIASEPPVAGAAGAIGGLDVRRTIAAVLRAAEPHLDPAAAAIVYAHVRRLVTLVRAGASCLVDPTRDRVLPRLPALAMLVHPQESAVPELADVLAACFPEAAIVLDPFAQSGATLAAAEATGRSARLVCPDASTCRRIAASWKELVFPTGPDPAAVKSAKLRGFLRPASP